MAKCRGAFTAAKFCLFSVILVLAGLLAGSALSGGKDSFFAAFLQTAAEPAATNEKRITIVIDAGHGGMDGGAVSDTGVLEKDLNLAVASRLCELFRLADADVVMDGRDIGTCVLPQAQLKIYLTADSMVRAKRRYKELTEKGVACDLDVIERDIRERDHQDMTRAISPLRQAEDAILVDTSELTIDEVVEKIIGLCRER